MADDFKANVRTAGSVAVGGETAGVIGKKNDVDWFAVELVAGRTYVIDLEGDAGGGLDAMLRGLYDAGGSRIAGTRNDDGGEGTNARLTFTATADGTHYIAARGDGGTTGAYTVRVTEMDTDAAPAGAADLGDLAGQDGARVRRDAVDGAADGSDYYRFTLSEAREVRLRLRDQDADADLHLEDSDGNVVASSTRGGTRNEAIEEALEAGTYYVRVVAREAGENAYALRYRVAEPEVAVQPEPRQREEGTPDREEAIPQEQQQAVPQSVSEPEGEDFSQDTSTRGRVAVGGSATGEVDYEGEYDWFAVALEAGKTYRIDLKGAPTGDGTLADPYLHGIHDADGNLVDGTWNHDAGTGNNAREYFTAGADTTYYVAAGGKDGHTGTYTVSVAEVPDDFKADTGTAGAVAVGGSATGEIDYERDVDWFAVELEAGKTYRIDLKGAATGDGTLANPALWGIHDPDGNFIPGTADDYGGTGNNSRALFTAGESATYHVAASGNDRHTGTYTVEVIDVSDDFTADTGTAGAVAVGGSATGAIELPGDRDWFAVELEAGKTYRIDLKGAATGDGTLADPQLRGIHDSDGNYIPGTANYDGGEGDNSRVDFTAGESGTYYVGAGGYDVSTETYRTGTYTVSVAEVRDDFTADTGTAGRVAVGGSVTGAIELPGDVDWFAAELEAGKTYRIDLKGAGTGDGTLANPALWGIHDSDGRFISGTGNDNGGDGLNSRVLFTAREDATYHVAAGGHRAHTGTYTVSVAEVPDDFTGDTGTAGAVAVGGSVTGEIELPGDVDWFAVELEADKTYRIDLKGAATGDGTLRDSALWGIHDPDGNLIPGTADDDGGTGDNSRVLFTARESGTYHVAAGGHDRHTGTYTVSVAYVDDFTADTGTAGAVAAGGSVTGEIDYERDVDWFAVELEAGKTYRIDLKGAATGDGTLANPALWGIHDPDGNFIPGTADGDGGTGNNSRAFFAAHEDGTYYVAASGHERHTGTYTVSVIDVSDDFTADAGTVGTVAVGGSVTGEIELPGDRDWFAVALEAGKTYRIDLKGAGTGDGTLANPALWGIHDPDGNFIPGTADDDSGTGNNSRALFTAREDATHYVAAGGHDRHTGTYTVSVTHVDGFTADTGTAGAVAVGGSVTGEIELPGDRDWFAVELEAGKTYRIDLKGAATGDGTLRDSALWGIHDSDGNLIPGTADDDGGTGDNSRVLFTAREDATYHVAAGGHDRHTGTYTVSVTHVDGFTADTGTAGAVAVGGSATGELELPGDRDWFAVELEAGKTYRIDLKGAATGDGTLQDPHLHAIYDANGSRIAWGDYDGGTGDNARVFFAATESGTHYVAAGGYDGDTHTYETGSYTVSVTEIEADDFTADAGTVGAVAVGGSATGEIELPGDRDWFAVELEAGKTYRIDLKGLDTDSGTLSNPLLRGIYDAEGNRIAGTRDRDGGTGHDSRVIFTAGEDATYYVEARGHDDLTGSYTVSVTEVSTDDFTADTGTAGAVTEAPDDFAADARTVAVGGSATGEVDYEGEYDWFAVELEAGKTYQVDLKGASAAAGTLRDPHLRGVYDAEGNRIRGTWDDDGGVGRAALSVFTAREDGTYYVAAGGRNGDDGTHSYQTGTYTVSVTEVAADDFTGDAGTSARVAVGGSATGAIDHGGDRDWFAVSFEAGKTYRIDLKGASTGDGTLADPVTGVFVGDGTGVCHSWNDNGGAGANARSYYTARDTATHYVLADGAHEGLTGSYTVSVEEVL